MLDGQIKLEDAKVRSALNRVLRALPAGGDATPVFRSIGRILKTGTQLRFREQKAPDGTPWKPSQRVLEEGGQTLRLTSRLRNSITSQADHKSATVGTNVVYARRHQLGDAARTQSIIEALKAGRTTARAGLVARPYLGASDADKMELIEAMNDHLGSAWRS